MTSRKTSTCQNIQPFTFNASISNNMCRKLPYFGSFFTNEVYSMMLFQIVLHVRFKNRDYLLFLYDSLYQCCMDLSQISTSDWYWRVLRGNTTVMVLIVRNLVFHDNALMYIISCELFGRISLLWHQRRHPSDKIYSH